jgi:hypothetical protein
VKPAEDSSQATAGKYCHAVAAQRLKDQEGAIGPEIVLPDFKGERFHEFIIGYYLDTVRLYVESYMAIAVEEEYEYEFDRFILTGHMDCTGIDADAKEFCALDLKAGLDPVTEAQENAQVLGYLVLLAMNYPTATKGTFAVVQPQNREEDGIPRVSHIMIEGREKLEALVHYLERELNHALDNPNQLETGWKQCHYCSAALICPAFKGEIDAMKLLLTPEQIAAIPTEPDLERLWFFEQAKRMFGGPLDTAHEALRDLVGKAGDTVTLKDGTKLYLTDRAGRRTFPDNAAVAAKLDDLEENLFWRCVTFGGGDIEDALAEHLKLPKTSKKGNSGQAEFRARMKGLYAQETHKILKAVVP